MHGESQKNVNKSDKEAFNFIFLEENLRENIDAESQYINFYFFIF